MRSLVLFAILSVAVAKPKPGGLYDAWGGAPSLSSVSLVHQPSYAVAQPVYHQPAPIVHAAPVAVAQPVVHAAPVAYAKPAATSYSSFHQVVHPVQVAQQVVHAAPVISQPVVHAAPVVQTIAKPVYQTVAQPLVHSAPVVQSYGYGSLGHGW